MPTAGDYVDGILSNLTTNLVLTVIVALILMGLNGGAPNRFITNIIILLTALFGWILGQAYGKRKVYRNAAGRGK